MESNFKFKWKDLKRREKTAIIFLYYTYCDNCGFYKGVNYTELPPKDENFYRIILFNRLLRDYINFLNKKSQ